ncbi:hypothetical protein KR018_003422 [Drosophila ironensis]|nr:hypothetical protein KR018_003422 [Drosophila ironensis]
MKLNQGLFCILTLCGFLEGSVSLRNILESLNKELSYRTILLLQSNTECWSYTDFIDNVPLVNVNANQSAFKNIAFNAKMLALVCLESNPSDLMKVLYENLQEIRETPTIIFALSDQQIHELFLECISQEMLHVLAFQGSDRSLIYSFRAFPKFQIIQRNVREIKRYFEPQLKDLGGHALKALPDNVMPRTVSYRDAQGNRQLAGYLTQFIKNYVSTLNATLEIIWDLVPEEGMSIVEHVVRKTDKSKIDFPMAYFAPQMGNASRKGIPIEISSWFLMLPMEPPLPRSRFFLNLGLQSMIPMAILMAVVLCNAHRVEAGLRPGLPCFCITNKILRGILAQPFVLPRLLSPKLMLIYWLLLISGFFMSNYYIANLATWLVHPPAGKQIGSWKQLSNSNFKILIVQSDLDLLREVIGNELIDTYIDTFQLADTVEFQKRRLSMDGSNAYPVTNNLWPILQLSQERLHRPIYRKSPEFVFVPFLPLSLPLPDNCIFRRSIQLYLGRTAQSGLYEFWFRKSFDEMVRLRKITNKVDRNYQIYQDLTWHNFYLVWLAYMALILISLVVFLVEIGYYRWRMQ